jgi:ABC-type antimicrobial peptide transport system permease subunit
VPMGERVDAQLMVPRTVSRLTLLFALTALLLATIGVYGTLAQSIVRRRREFGVRRALGAQDHDIVRQVIGQGLAPVLLGLAVGVPLTLLLGNRLSDVLYTISPLDLRAWLLALTCLLSVAVAICYLLGRRAVRALPMQALRDE